MAKHIGIVACSAEGAALCYRTICAEAPALMGEHCHPEITMHTFPLSSYMLHIRTGEWPAVADLMVVSARKVAGAGAQFAVCPDNTIHEAFGWVVDGSPIPWLHIGRVVAEEARRRGLARLGVLGTRYLMEGPVYPDALRPLGIESLVPNEQERQMIDDIIFGELVNGVFTPASRGKLVGVIAELQARGAEAVVLGCTEIPLIIGPEDSPLPTLDSTRLLARAALQESLA